MLSVKQTSITKVILLISLVSAMSVYCESEQQRAYYEIKELYDKSEYIECIDKCQNLIRLQEETIFNKKNYRLLAWMYELQADCLAQKGNINQAVEAIQVLLLKLEQFLPGEHVARIKLKIGHIYKSAGLYSKALANFKKVEQEYESIFPDRFAKYAHENYNDILNREAAVISGKVFHEENMSLSGAIVKVFNGFQESEAKTSQDGSYSIPLFSSTPHTKFSLCVYKQGYMPEIVNKTFNGVSKIMIEEIQLKKLPNNDASVIAGVVFGTISGGKRKPHCGIANFGKKYEIKIERLPKKETISTLSDDDGIYAVVLTPGHYLISDGKREKIIKLNRGEAQIVYITGAACIMVD